MASWMVGIDTGGTFTDLIAFDAESGERRLAKVARYRVSSELYTSPRFIR